MLPLLVALAVFTGVGIARYCPGCIDRGRVNKGCQSTGDSAFSIDWQDTSHWRHLTADAQLAEDLAIRYADAEFNRVDGYEAHGGLIEQGRVRNECMARLATAIETNHDVTSDQIAIACRHLDRRFSVDGRAVRLMATGLASIAACLCGLQLGGLWLSVWEAIRVRNGHMSTFRAATSNRWPHQHSAALFIGGPIAFWLIAVWWRHVPRTLGLNASVVSCTLLGAMFCDVFLQNATGYTLALAVLLGTIIALGSAERFAVRQTHRPVS